MGDKFFPFHFFWKFILLCCSLISLAPKHSCDLLTLGCWGTENKQRSCRMDKLNASFIFFFILSCYSSKYFSDNKACWFYHHIYHLQGYFWRGLGLVLTNWVNVLSLYYTRNLQLLCDIYVMLCGTSWEQLWSSICRILACLGFYI